MILLAALLSQDPIVDLGKYKAAYEPYRRCVLSAAKSAYTSGDNFKLVYQNVQRTCSGKRVQYAMDALLISSERASTDRAMLADRDIDQQVGAVLDEELMLELAQDFVPRSK